MSRCEKCDREAASSDQRAHFDACMLPPYRCKQCMSVDDDHVCIDANNSDCCSRAIDWRARALAAEARLDDAAGQITDATEYIPCLTGELFASWDALDLAESIARRALVEGLAEATRSRLVAAAAESRAKVWQEFHQDCVARPSEQAIRADAVRAERERCATFLEAEAERLHGLAAGMAQHGDHQSSTRYEHGESFARSFARDIRNRDHWPADGDHAKGGG